MDGSIPGKTQTARAHVTHPSTHTFMFSCTTWPTVFTGFNGLRKTTREPEFEPIEKETLRRYECENTQAIDCILEYPGSGFVFVFLT